VNHIAVFARWPAPGRVKRRLSPALPEALACDLYRALLADALATAAAAAADTRTLWWAGAPADRSAFELPAGFAVRDQDGADLGARLERACAELLARPTDRAVIIGADCPDLAASHLGEAFALLDSHDLALGPARDGGYTLIGLAGPAPELFQDVAWGTAEVLEQTLERAGALGLSVARLPPLGDLDTPADLVNWLSRMGVAGAIAAPRARAALVTMGLIPPA
jgi:rSAM/selenodomain-associated transferase 1